MKSTLLLVAALLAPAAARAQSGSFVILLGSDTIGVERFARTSDTLHGELKTRGVGPRLVYSLTFADGAAAVLVMSDTKAQELGLTPKARPTWLTPKPRPTCLAQP